MNTETVKPAEKLHPDYDIGFHEGATYGYQQACGDLIHFAPSKILEALRKAGGKHGEGTIMHVPQDLDIIRSALEELRAYWTHPESIGTGIDPAGNPE